MTKTQAVQALIDSVEAKGASATAEELVFLAKAIEAIAAPATVAELESTSAEILVEFESAKSAAVSAITSAQTTATDAVGAAQTTATGAVATALSDATTNLNATIQDSLNSVDVYSTSQVDAAITALTDSVDTTLAAQGTVITETLDASTVTLNDAIAALDSTYTPTLSWSSEVPEALDNVAESSSYNFTQIKAFTAFNSEDATVSYSISGGALPTGLSLNSSTGDITGTAEDLVVDETSFFYVTASDGISDDITRYHCITVSATNAMVAWKSSVTSSGGIVPHAWSSLGYAITETELVAIDLNDWIDNEPQEAVVFNLVGAGSYPDGLSFDGTSKFVWESLAKFEAYSGQVSSDGYIDVPNFYITVADTQEQAVGQGITLRLPTSQPAVGEQIYYGSRGGNSSSWGYHNGYDNNWTCPEGVTSVNVVCIGGGSGGQDGWANTAGSGGGLGYKNNIPVTAGQSYTAFAGHGGYGNSGWSGGTSYFMNTSTVAGGGAGHPSWSSGDGLASGNNTYGGGYRGDGGGQGGNASNYQAGGGAGGYQGRGYNQSTKGSNTGWGGGGGGSYSSTYGYSAGGGTGVWGMYGGCSGHSEACASDSAGAKAGNTPSHYRGYFTPWSQDDYGGGWGAYGGERGRYGENPWSGTGESSSNIYGGNNGGGGGGPGTSWPSASGHGGRGAVRIIWGSNRNFPSGQCYEVPSVTGGLTVL